MYNNLIEEDIMILDNEFFKIYTMFEYVDKMYDIKMKELEYNYIYTESINEEYVDLYTEAEEAKSKNEQGLLGRLFTAILNFIRKIRAKILRFFGNDKKASELEAKIKGNPKLANQTVEITNTTDAEKAIDEGTSFFGSLIDKIVKGTATEADADDAEEKNKSLLSRIGIFAGGALLAAGGAKVTSDKLKERGVTKQTIKEAVSNLLKREEDTKKKSNKVTQTNEQNVQKAQQAMNNNSQSGNEENTKAGRRIVGSYKDFITDAGKFFTGKVSELKSKINGVSSDEQQTTTSQARPKIVNYPEFSDATDNDKEKLIMDASKAIKTISQNSERGKREKENLEKIISKGISINSGDYNTLVNVVRNGDISKKYKESNNKKNEQPKNKTDIQMDDEEASIRCKHIIREIKTYDSTNHVLTKDEMQKINEIDKKTTNKKCTENDLNMVQKINDDMKKRTPDTSRNANIFNFINTEEPNSYCNRTIKEIETEPGEGAKLTDDEKKQIDEIKDRLKNKKCTENDVKILDRISDEQDKRRQSLLKNDKTKSETKSDNQDHELSSKEKIDGEIRRLLNKFSNYVYFNSPSLLTLSPMKQYVEKGFSIVSPEDLPKANFHVNDEIFNFEPETIVKEAKRILDSYSIYSKYKNPDKNKVEEALKNQLRYNKIDYSDVDREMDDIKTTFTTLDKYAKELNELIKKRETFKESSYDLINDILTIFENSF